MADADFSVKAIISAQTSQFEKGIKNAQASVNSLSSSLNNITNLVKKAFAFTGIAVGTKAVVDFGKSCVQSANQAIKQFNILDNTVKATGADAWTSTENLKKASEELSQSTNYSVTEIQKMQSVLLGFTNITGEAFDGASEAVLDMATVMGMDLTSAVQTVGKALDDPITGLDSLRRQGFKFTDEQKAELAQLVKNGKQLEAQKIILDSLSISYGGAGKAGQDSFAKQRHAIENIKDAIGTKLIPVMQVFAENNAKTIDSLRKLIENIDFTPVINVVTNLKKIFSDTFNTMSGYLQNVGNYISDFISRFNFKPIISVLDTLIGVLAGVISKFKEINSQRLEIFDKLKEALIDFSNSETFQNIVNFVNKIIDAVFFLWEEIQEIGMEIRNLVVNKIIEIWGKIKELFQKSQNSLSESGQDIASWGDLFYDILNNAFRIFQDFFGMVKALIHGDWAVAWEYAKLTVMRITDNILDAFSTIANAFPDLINVFLKGWNWIIEQINKARAFFGQDPLDLAGAFESVDLSKKSGLEDKIKEAENKIQELTGKSADITIQNLEGVSTKFAGFTQHVLGDIENLTKGAETSSEKQKEYFSDVISSGESSYEKFSEWDSKLLQQRLENLNEWSTEYHDIQLALIEEERKKAIEADKTGAESEKINKYFNGKIEAEDKRFQDAKKQRVKEMLNFIAQSTVNAVKSIVETFKKVISTISKVIKSGFDIFKKLFSINIDDMLNTLLEFEDSVLTFFVETLPRLPDFIASVIQSIAVLFQSLKANIKAETISDVIFNMLKQLSDSLPALISDLLDILTELLNGAIDGLIRWLDEDGIKTIFSLLLKIQKVAEDFVSNNLEKIVDMLANHVDDFANFLAESMTSANKTLPKIIKAITKLIITIVQVIGKIFENKEFVESIIQAIIDIVKIILDNLPKLIGSLVDAIISIIKALIPYLPKLLQILINAIFDAIPSIMGSLIEGFGKIFKEIFSAIFNGDFWKDVFGGFGDFFNGEAQGTITGSKGWDTVLGVATGGISELGKWLHWWANGTQNAPAGLSVVGEAGPELVKFRGGEQVINNRNTQKLLQNANGSTNNFNVTFNNLQDTSAYAMMNQLKQYNRQMAINGVL